MVRDGYCENNSSFMKPVSSVVAVVLSSSSEVGGESATGTVYSSRSFGLILSAVLFVGVTYFALGWVVSVVVAVATGAFFLFALSL